MLVLDHFNDWRPTLESYAATLAQLCDRLELSVDFEELDMLDSSSMPRHTRCSSAIANPCSRLAEAVSRSELCTLFYAFSELHDSDHLATERCIATAFSAAHASNTRWVCADPASIEHDKSEWLDRQAAAQGTAL